MFGNKKDEHTMFRKSSPYGYDPVSVEKKIAKYEETIEKIIKINDDLRLENKSIEEENMKLKNEIRNLQLQLSMQSDRL